MKGVKSMRPKLGGVHRAPKVHLVPSWMEGTVAHHTTLWRWAVERIVSCPKLPQSRPVPTFI